MPFPSLVELLKCGILGQYENSGEFQYANGLDASATTLGVVGA